MQHALQFDATPDESGHFSPGRAVARRTQCITRMWPALALAAAVIGALSGGGAMLALPVLVASGATHDEAVVRSLIVVGAASAVAAVAHARAGRIDLGTALRFSIAGSASAFVVGHVSSGWSVPLGATVFGGLGVMAALDLWRGRGASSAVPSVWGEVATAAGVGALSGWIGAGGGFLLVPLLARRTTFERALGTASVVLAAQALAGVVGHATTTSMAALPIALDASAGIVGALVGLAFASRIPVARLRGAVAALTATLAMMVAWSDGWALAALVLGLVPMVYGALRSAIGRTDRAPSADEPTLRSES